MGKSKGGKYFKPPRNRRPGGGAAGPGEEEESSEEEYSGPSRRGLGAQAATAGMLPPSDSEDEGDEGEASAPPKAVPVKAEADGKGDAKKIAKPDDDDDEDDESEESESSDDSPVNEYLSGPRQPKKVQQEERDPETIRKDMERLQLIRRKREEDRLKRIADEGWDRFAPLSETNKPPGHGPVAS